LATGFALALPAVGHAATFEVNTTTGTNTPGCGATVVGCNTITYAIAEAAGSAVPDTINVAAGDYPELVDIPETEVGLTLRGPKAAVAGRLRTGLAATGEARIVSPVSLELPAINVVADNVTVEGFAISNSQRIGVLLLKDSATIRNNVIRDNTIGLWINPTTSASDVTGNNFDGNNHANGGSLFSPGYGIYSPGGMTAIIGANAITNNLFTNHDVSGIDINADPDEEHGFPARQTSENVSITGNEFGAQTGTGPAPHIYASRLIGTSKIEGNTLADSDSDGIFADGAGLSISKNKIDKSAGAGIKLTAPADCSTPGCTASAGIKINGNTITNSTSAGVLIRVGAVADGQTVNVHYNRFAGNATAVRNTDPATVDAENNFYNCNAGPGGAPCDDVVGADADPYLVLKATASPTALTTPGASTITASFLANNAGPLAEPTLTSAQALFPATTVGFGVAGVGTLSAPNATTSAGVASVTDSSTAAGSSTVTATAGAVNVTIALGDAAQADGVGRQAPAAQGVRHGHPGVRRELCREGQRHREGAHRGQGQDQDLHAVTGHAGDRRG